MECVKQIVSCVILNYNDSETTVKLLNKIKDYSNLDYIVVVDNNSTDDSYAVLRQLSNEKIHVLKSDRNGGYGAGNNIGIRYSYDHLKADFTLIANPDIMVENACIAKLVESLKLDSNAAAITAKQNGSCAARKDASTLKYVLATSLFFDIGMGILNYKKRYFDGKKSAEVFVIPGSMLLVDTKKMVEYGMYDEEFFLYFEEQVLATKLKCNGLHSLIRTDVRYEHEHHVSVSKTYRRWSAQHKILLNSARLFLKKYKKASAISMALAELFFVYTKVEFFFYDLFRMIKPLRR